MANATDGTQIAAGGGTGDLISDEDMTGNPRLSSLVPQLGASNASYKIERTKLVVGDYDNDRGDISNDGGRALPIETMTERRLMEQQLFQSLDVYRGSLCTRQRERPPHLHFNRTGRDGRM